MKNSIVYNTILSRRDEREFSEKPVSSETVERLIQAAVWAPNHKWTEPWRFASISSENKDAFIQAYTSGIENLENKYGAKDLLIKKAQKVREDFLKIPLFIAVAYKRDEHENTDRENLITVACGVQNLLLAAEEEGISAHWSSGKATRTNEITEFLGFDKDEFLIGILQMGYPVKKSTSKRADYKKFLRWI